MDGERSPSDDVVLAAEKWDGRFNRSAQMRPLGSDELGAWFGGRPGREVRWSNGEGRRVDDWSVICVSTREWWRATWYAREGGPVQVYVDIGHPLTDDPAGPFLDLDLDVEGPAEGPYEVLDRDEFAENAVRHGYPPDVVERAERTTLEVLTALEAGLGELGIERLRQWRDAVRASGVA